MSAERVPEPVATPVAAAPPAQVRILEIDVPWDPMTCAYHRRVGRVTLLVVRERRGWCAEAVRRGGDYEKLTRRRDTLGDACRAIEMRIAEVRWQDWPGKIPTPTLPEDRWPDEEAAAPTEGERP